MTLTPDGDNDKDLTPHSFWNITDFGYKCPNCETKEDYDYWVLGGVVVVVEVAWLESSGLPSGPKVPIVLPFSSYLVTLIGLPST